MNMIYRQSHRMVYSKMDELYPVSDEVQKLYEEIFELLTPIMKSDDNDKYCILWIRPTPPTMEEYIAYWIGEREDYESEEEWLEAQESLKKGYKSEFSYSLPWYKLSVRKNIDRDGKLLCKFFSIDNNYIIIEYEEAQYIADGDYSSIIGPLLEEILLATKDSMKMIEDGTYETTLNSTLQLTRRAGIIPVSTYSRVENEYWNHILDNLTQEEKNSFVSLYRMGETEAKKCKKTSINELIYIYKTAIGAVKQTDDKEEIDRYFDSAKRTSCFDFSSFNRDSYDAFLKWMKYNEKQRMGGHYFTLIDGSSVTRISLKPEIKDDGVLWYIGGNEECCVGDQVRAFLSLHGLGIPVTLYNSGNIDKMIEEQGYVCIAPHDYWMRPMYFSLPGDKYDIVKKVTLSTEDNPEELINSIEWIPWKLEEQDWVV